MDAWPLVAVAAIVGLAASAAPARAQDDEKVWKYPGLVELTGQLYRRRPNPADTTALADLRGQIGVQGPLRRWLSVRARWDLRVDTHTDVDEGRWLDLSQRGLRSPAGGLGELYLDLALPHTDVRLGTQQVRWGRADGFNPTDNVNPYDYSYPFSTQRLAVPTSAARAWKASGCLSSRRAGSPCSVSAGIRRCRARRWLRSVPRGKR